jgi:hypothetical protein
VDARFRVLATNQLLLCCCAMLCHTVADGYGAHPTGIATLHIIISRAPCSAPCTVLQRTIPHAVQHSTGHTASGIMVLDAALTRGARPCCRRGVHGLRLCDADAAAG